MEWWHWLLLIWAITGIVVTLAELRWPGITEGVLLFPFILGAFHHEENDLDTQVGAFHHEENDLDTQGGEIE